MQKEVAETLLQLLSTELWLRIYVMVAAIAIIILVACTVFFREMIRRRIRQFKTWMWKTPQQHYGYYVIEREVDSLEQYVDIRKRDEGRWQFFSEKLWCDKRTGKWWFKVKGYRVNP